MAFKIVLHIFKKVLAIQTAKFAFHIPSRSLHSSQEKGLLVAYKYLQSYP